MRYLFFILCFLIIPVSGVATSDNSEFSFVTNIGTNPGPTLLIVGGIDGDEPGGFHAAATLVTRYQITSGQLWIVPDLNRDAILKRERGEMNLKFARISKKDPLYRQVQNIKRIINDEQVDLVINLHDGSGFYHPKRVNRLRSPGRWGQSFVIDQKFLGGKLLGDLHGLSAASIKTINGSIRNRNEHFHLKNMRTATLDSNAPTYHSLTWYALRNNKPALSIESSKTHPVHVRTYFLLRALEALMNEAGVSFTRDFTLTPAEVRRVIQEDGHITLAQGRIALSLNGMNSELPEFPLPAADPGSVMSANPLVSLQPENGGYRIHYGNNRLALLRPRPVTLDPEPGFIELTSQGITQQVASGAQVGVTSEVRIKPPDDVTIRVVGLKANGDLQKSLKFSLGDLNPKLAIDREGKIYRLEMYRDKLFSGMILLNFR